MSVFGNQINLYREKRHLTFEQLAQDISKGQERDYTKSFVQHVTNGTKTNISLSDILLFSNALQVPPVLLLIDTMQPFARLPPADLQWHAELQGVPTAGGNIRTPIRLLR